MGGRLRRVWLGLGVLWLLYIGWILIRWSTDGAPPTLAQWMVPACGLVAVVCGLFTARSLDRGTTDRDGDV
ncbi:hypothetical protein [Desertihabitans aurantiacus]|uniref:hypothetical protein n=1 Tax=Desertihabitans aurantiacus TaxID=2282477 RepID=UPI000DF82232|nr:hypothetical protein [Desertihabitans aurantiacus]